MRRTLAGVRWPWVLASLGGVAAAFTGYRFFSLFAIMPFSFAALPALRSIGNPSASPSPEPAIQPAP